MTEDGGLSWRFDKQVTADGMHPGHILQLADGGLLLSCGIRLKNNWGIGVALSRDQGASWSWMSGLCNFGAASDGGYPASVQLADGSILTHYYISGVPFCERYFVGQARWELDELFEEGIMLREREQGQSKTIRKKEPAAGKAARRRGGELHQAERIGPAGI